MTTLSGFLEAEPFALAMSSGFFGFFAHAGMVSALEHQGLSPASFTGSSAGALIASLSAAGHGAASIERELGSLRREDFWDPAPGAGLLRGARFQNRLRSLLPSRFDECPSPLALSVYDVFRRQTLVLRDGDLPSAVAASCAVPLLFQPVWRERCALLDGGLRDRPGIAGLAPDARVLHHHLSSRSPWRRPGSPALVPPRFERGVTLVLDGLPRSGPFALDVGRTVLSSAREATLRALHRPLENGLVRIHIDATS